MDVSRLDSLLMETFHLTTFPIDSFKFDYNSLLNSSMFDTEDKILNSLWMFLLGLETLMVLGVAVWSLVKRFISRPPVVHHYSRHTIIYKY